MKIQLFITLLCTLNIAIAEKITTLYSNYGESILCIENVKYYRTFVVGTGIHTIMLRDKNDKPIQCIMKD